MLSVFIKLALSEVVEPSSKRDYIHLIECSGPLSSNSGIPGDYMIPNEVLPYIEDRPTRGRALTDSNLSTLNENRYYLNSPLLQ